MKPEKNNPVPDMAVTEFSGEGKQLKDFRRKLHVVLVNEPRAEAETLAGWKKSVAAESQRWTWLQAVFAQPKPGSNLDEGVYLVSRWGNLIEFYGPGAWSFDAIEKDLLYFESQDCCELREAP